jgi:large subunit ribosomal protein L24
MNSKSPGKQRKALYNASLHKRQKLVHAHLTKELRKLYKKRNLGVRKGDDVKILRGDFKGKTGKVTKVALKDMLIYVDGMKRKKTTGEDVEVAFHPSNIMITNLSMDDARRKKIIQKVK